MSQNHRVGPWCPVILVEMGPSLAAGDKRMQRKLDYTQEEVRVLKGRPPLSFRSARGQTQVGGVPTNALGAGQTVDRPCWLPSSSVEDAIDYTAHGRTG